jgi:hypothetical protein
VTSDRRKWFGSLPPLLIPMRAKTPIGIAANVLRKPLIAAGLGASTTAAILLIVGFLFGNGATAQAAHPISRPAAAQARANTLVRWRLYFQQVSPHLSYRQISRYIGPGASYSHRGDTNCWEYAGKDGRWAGSFCISGPTPRPSA